MYLVRAYKNIHMNFLGQAWYIKFETFPSSYKGKHENQLLTHLNLCPIF